MTLRELVIAAEYQLRKSPHPGRARQDAEALLLHCLHRDRAWLLAHWNTEGTADGVGGCETDGWADYQAAITRRAVGEPIQYITGQSDFFGLPFSVGPGVLIPRPETEHLVEEVIRLARQFSDPYLHIADIGTGSGIIAVALADALPNAQITAVDCSLQALAIARENAERHQVQDRLHFTDSDLLTALNGQSFHIIASNPPYVPTSDRDSLSVEVRDHEPHSALFAGEDGLDIYRRLIPDAYPLLNAGGWLVLEIGYGQQRAVEELLQANGYSSIRFIDDYQAIPRVAVAQSCPAS